MNWINELVEEFLKANQGFENWMVDKAEERKEANLADGKTASYDSEKGHWIDEEGNEYKDIIYNAEKDIYELGEKINKKQPTEVIVETGRETEETETIETTTTTSTTTTSSGNTSSQERRKISSNGAESPFLQAIGMAKKEVDTVSTTNTKKETTKKTTGGGGLVKLKYAYKKGGLADFTGPAWLDGTKASPELVLNATDTQNFIQLKDILSSLLHGGKPQSQTSGDNYYDIHITVEEINDDYDVDQMIERVKERIHEDASYRNVNAINFLR